MGVVGCGACYDQAATGAAVSADFVRYLFWFGFRALITVMAHHRTILIRL